MGISARAALCIAGFIALGACDGAGTTAKGVDTSDAVADAAWRKVQAGDTQIFGMPAPANLPPYALILPSSFITATTIADQGPTSGSVEFSTAFQPGAVTGFYRRAAAQAGLKVLKAETLEDASVLTASAGSRSLTVRAEAIEGVGSTVHLRYL